MIWGLCPQNAVQSGGHTDKQTLKAVATANVAVTAMAAKMAKIFRIGALLCV
jgi:hypothetical protein